MPEVPLFSFNSAKKTRKIGTSIFSGVEYVFHMKDFREVELSVIAVSKQRGRKSYKIKLFAIAWLIKRVSGMVLLFLQC